MPSASSSTAGSHAETAGSRRAWSPASFLPRASVRELVEAVEASGAGAGETVCILLAEQGAPDLDGLCEALVATGISFCGALVPAVLHGGACARQGALVRTFPLLAPPFFLDLSAPTFPDALRAAPRQSPSFSGFAPSSFADIPAEHPATAFVLLDGLSPHVAPFLTRLYDRLGDRVTYFGGGGGSLTLRQRPCVFGPAGVRQDAGIILLLDAACDLDVRHGWKRVAGPFVATRIEGTTICELNWDHAGAVYRRAVEQVAGAGVWERTPFNEVVAAYPLGIARRGAEDLARDITDITIEDGIVCIGAVPENASLYLMYGRPEHLLASVQHVDVGQREGGTAPIYGGLIADCVSRFVYLGEDYERELAALQASFHRAKAGTLEGMLSLGEIASRGDGLVEFHNKTVVTSVFSARS